MKTIISGRYAKGLGKGRYFMSQHGYKSQFVRKLGIDPYRGTFNVRLSGEDIKKFNRLKRRKGVTIKGFVKGGKTFGSVMAYKAEVMGIRCAIVVPERTTHSGIVELVSSKMLRKTLRLRRGGRVDITLA